MLYYYLPLVNTYDAASGVQAAVGRGLIIIIIHVLFIIIHILLLPGLNNNTHTIIIHLPLIIIIIHIHT